LADWDGRFSQHTRHLEPEAGLIFDAAGNLYGTASAGGRYPYGVVFELTPANGQWTEKVLHNFNIGNGDGDDPAAPLTFDSAGNLYGTTVQGSTCNCGVVFELKLTSRDKWTETLLHKFNGKNGLASYAGLILDAKGNLYGTTSGGGAYSGGTVFEITP
jgi:uncharacterized repeat protein (TIGR03803 family)